MAAASQPRQAPKSRSLEDWLKSGLYLPPILRSADNQGELFRFLDRVQENGITRYKQNHQTTEEAARQFYVPSIAAHIYVIDIFLWMLAKFGYTLQQTRYAVEPLYDLETNLKAWREERQAVFAEELRAYLDTRRKEREQGNNGNEGI